MSELEEKLNSVLKDPQLMQQLLFVAQSLGAQAPEAKEPVRKEHKESPRKEHKESPKKEHTAQTPQQPLILDPKLMQGLAGLAQKGCVDQDQQALLNALCPYLSRERLNKLERAMGAARLAGAASSFLNAGGLQMLSGR